MKQFNSVQKIKNNFRFGVDFFFLGGGVLSSKVVDDFVDESSRGTSREPMVYRHTQVAAKTQGPRKMKSQNLLQAVGPYP